MNIVDIFPDIDVQDFREVDLNEEARIYLTELWVLADGKWMQPNPLINADECDKFLQHVHHKYGTRFSYGGYGEDRSILWHDTYLDTLRAYHHLGIDINVPAWTRIVSPISGRVVVSDHDKDHPTAPQHHGWGNRLIITPDDSEYALILAHLSSDTRRVVGTIITRWETLWTIWTPKQNGWWFEHFHIQAISRRKLEDIMRAWKLSELDGYAVSMDEETQTIYPSAFTVF